MERKLASIRRIDAIDPIDGADAIEVATVGGWKVVVKRGEFAAGDLAVYLEIDSWVPHELAPFLSKGSEPREFNGVKGERLRTAKLRGQVSQGLLIPISAVYGKIEPIDIQEGRDIGDLLGIQKWEAPVPAHLEGQVKGLFPSFIRKTDQERCQNLKDTIFLENKGSAYEVTIKLDGSSATFFHRDGEIGVCSRNLQLKVSEENSENTFVKLLIESGLEKVLPQLGNVAIQGELCGEGIQGNREKLKGHRLFIFDVQDLDASRYFTPLEREEFISRMLSLGVRNELVQHVPIVTRDITLEALGISSIEGLLSFADGSSLNNPMREGLVFKRMDGEFSFKSISNKFLMQVKE